jgi:hypothetical protein
MESTIENHNQLKGGVEEPGPQRNSYKNTSATKLKEAFRIRTGGGAWKLQKPKNRRDNNEIVSPSNVRNYTYKVSPK